MMVFLKLVCDTGWFVLVPYRSFSVIVISETICISIDFFSCVLYYIKLHYITFSYYLVYASLLSLLQLLFFCLHVRLLYAIKYYLLTYLLTCMFLNWCVQFRMYNEGFQPWYRDRARFDLRGTTTRQYVATEEGLAAINTVLNANFKYLWLPAILYCK